jgi:transcriptional regulator with XRE-family HTH domain
VHPPLHPGRAASWSQDREGWTLKEMSAKSGIPVSTLSKVEHDRLTLTYDKLQQLAQRLGLRMSELFAEGRGVARRSRRGAAWAILSTRCA